MLAGGDLQYLVLFYTTHIKINHKNVRPLPTGLDGNSLIKLELIGMNIYAAIFNGSHKEYWEKAGKEITNIHKVSMSLYVTQDNTSKRVSPGPSNMPHHSK